MSAAIQRQTHPGWQVEVQLGDLRMQLSRCRGLEDTYICTSILCSLLVVLPKKHVYCTCEFNTVCRGTYSAVDIASASKTCDWSMCALDR